MAITYCITTILDWAQPSKNMLVNGGFDFAQLYDPTASTSITSGNVGPDCWRIKSETGTTTAYLRESNSGLGYRSAFRGKFSPTSPDRIIVYQGIPSVLSKGLQSHNVDFSITINSSLGTAFSLSLLQWNSTADSIGSGITPSWPGFGMPPSSFGASASILAQAGSFPLNASEITQLNLVACSLPSANNLIVVVSIDNATSSGQFFELAEAGLHIGAQNRPQWQPRMPGQEIERIEMFIEKSYNVDTKPGTVTDIGAYQGAVRTSMIISGQAPIPYRRTKVKIPTVTFYSPTTGTSGDWHTTSSSDVPVSQINSSSLNNTGAHPLTITDKDQFKGHYVIDASL